MEHSGCFRRRWWVVVLGGLLLWAGLPGVARAFTPPPVLTKLANGLPVYACVDDYSDKYVAVRLIVDTPPCLPGSRVQRTYQTLAYSMFRDSCLAKDLYEYLEERACYADLEVGYRNAVFSFDVLPEYVDSLFARMARQWETSLLYPQFEKGKSEIESAPFGYEAPAMEQLISVVGGECLDFWMVRNLDVTSLFAMYMNVPHLSLVVVGSKENVERALESARALERIPSSAGEYKFPVVRDRLEVTTDPLNYGDVLRGDITWDDADSWAIGLSVPVVVEGAGTSGRAHGANPAETNFYYLALHARFNDVVSLRHGSVYGVIGSLYLGMAEHVMVFQTFVDPDIARYDKLAAEMKAVAAELADSSSVGWWRGYVEGRAQADAFYGVNASDAAAVADGLAGVVTFARLSGREDLAEPFLPSPEEAQRGFARLLESAEWFVVEPASESWASVTFASVGAGFGWVYQNFYGQDERTRALSVMCQCLLVLMVLRRVERRMEGALIRANGHAFPPNIFS